jgi:hypothetical protein
VREERLGGNAESESGGIQWIIQSGNAPRVILPGAWRHTESRKSNRIDVEAERVGGMDGTARIEVDVVEVKQVFDARCTLFV